MIDAKIRREAQNRKLSTEDAISEIVADGCEMMLKNSQAFKELAMEHTDLAEKLLGLLEDLIGRIKDAFEDVTAGYRESQLLSDMEDIQQKWDAAFKEAVKQRNHEIGTIQQSDHASMVEQVEEILTAPVMDKVKARKISQSDALRKIFTQLTGISMEGLSNNKATDVVMEYRNSPQFSVWDDRRAEYNLPAIYIKNTRAAKYVDMILDGVKTVETRTTKALEAFRGREVGIIKNGYLVGYVTISSKDPIEYTVSDFHSEKNQAQHRVPVGDAYDIKDGGIKYGYRLENPKKITPVKLDRSSFINGDYTSRDISKDIRFNLDTKKTTTNGGNIQYSIYDTDLGSVAYFNENILDRKPENVRITDYVEQYIIERAIEDGRFLSMLSDTADPVFVSDELGQEYTGSKYTKSIRSRHNDIFDAKMRAAYGMSDIVGAAVDGNKESVIHADNKDAKNGVFRYASRFAFPIFNSDGSIRKINAYTCDILINHASDGIKYLYDILNIKKDTATAQELLYGNSAANKEQQLRGISESTVTPFVFYVNKDVKDFIKHKRDSMLFQKKGKDLFEAEKEFFDEYQNGKANESSFAYNTIAEFTTTSRPNRKPDYVTHQAGNTISSEYWYTEDGVIRGSDHWGYAIDNCDWYIDGYYGSARSYTEGEKYGYCSWVDFTQKTKLIRVNGNEYILSSFENTKNDGSYNYEDATYYKNGRVKLSKWSEADEEYLRLAENPTENAAKIANLVKQAAKEAMPDTKVLDKRGMPLVLYHGTTSKGQFHTFKDGMIFMFSRENYADQYTHTRGAVSVNPVQTGRVMPLFANITNPLVIDANRKLWKNIDVPWTTDKLTTDEIASYAKEHGYDGVILKRVRDNMFDDDTGYCDEYIVFDKSQVKSAGPSYRNEKRDTFPWESRDVLDRAVGVTYDDNGNVIPLSERFNADNPDIRYSSWSEEELESGVKEIGDTAIISDTGKIQLSVGTYRDAIRLECSDHCQRPHRKGQPPKGAALSRFNRWINENQEFFG